MNTIQLANQVTPISVFVTADGRFFTDHCDAVSHAKVGVEAIAKQHKLPSFSEWEATMAEKLNNGFGWSNYCQWLETQVSPFQQVRNSWLAYEEASKGSSDEALEWNTLVDAIRTAFGFGANVPLPTASLVSFEEWFTQYKMLANEMHGENIGGDGAQYRHCYTGGLTALEAVNMVHRAAPTCGHPLCAGFEECQQTMV